MLKVGRSVNWSEVRAVCPVYREKEAYRDHFNAIMTFAELLKETFKVCSARLLEKLDKIL